MTEIGGVITEFLEDHTKLKVNRLNRKFYDTHVPRAMLSITDYNPVRKGVATMLKNFSGRSKIDFTIDHFVKVADYLEVQRPEFNNYHTEF